MDFLSIAFAIVTLVVGLFVGYIIRKTTYEKELDDARNTATGILENANKEAETMKKEALLEAKDESHRYRTEIEAELKERRVEISRQENR